MTDLRIETVDGDAMLRQWRHVHNVIVPPAAMSLDEVRERAARHRLCNAYAGDELVGCSTVRAPEGEERAVMVIARVLPGHRGQGYGTALYEDGLAHARGMRAGAVDTCVLAVNEEGLAFARARGFAETERYTLDGESDVWVDLRLAPAAD
ncbi:GNAT family N-acetyltransferase [Streptomyces sp. NPDC005017]|uniref:GNAT family N-acetyltransferase n=1 Tax=Streptomyces sp. NPDC005017 TaxID=3364706 RepID=UPI0036AB8B80